MKKIFTLFAITVAGLGLHAQSFQLLDPDNGSADVSNTTFDFWSDPSMDVIKELNLKNNSSSSKTVKMKRTFVSGVNTSLPDQDTIEICWNVCLAPTWGTTQTAGNVTVAAGGVASFSGNGIGFHGTLKPCSILGVRVVRYTFWDASNTNDSVSVVFNYHVTATGVAENNIKQFNFSNPMPNPAAGSTSIKYDFPTSAKAKIKLYNAVGALVKEIKIEDQIGKITIDTDELSNGIYFYSLIVNDKVAGTKKLIVSH